MQPLPTSNFDSYTIQNLYNCNLGLISKLPFGHGLFQGFVALMKQRISWMIIMCP